MKPHIAFAIFSLMFTLLALYVPMSDVQQGQAIGFALFTGALSLAGFEGQSIANKRQNRK